MAIILVDLCYMIGTCYGPVATHEQVHPFLLSLRSYTHIANGKSFLNEGVNIVNLIKSY